MGIRSSPASLCNNTQELFFQLAGMELYWHCYDPWLYKTKRNERDLNGMDVSSCLAKPKFEGWTILPTASSVLYFPFTSTAMYVFSLAGLISPKCYEIRALIRFLQICLGQVSEDRNLSRLHDRHSLPTPIRGKKSKAIRDVSITMTVVLGPFISKDGTVRFRCETEHWGV